MARWDAAIWRHSVREKVWGPVIAQRNPADLIFHKNLRERLSFELLSTIGGVSYRKVQIVKFLNKLSVIMSLDFKDKFSLGTCISGTNFKYVLIIIVRDQVSKPTWFDDGVCYLTTATVPSEFRKLKALTFLSLLDFTLFTRFTRC